jgi:hypothetical protein
MGPRHNPYSISLKGHLHPGLESLVLRLPFNPRPQSNLENGFSSTVTVFSKDAEPIRYAFSCSYYDIVKVDLIKSADKTESVLYPAET